MSIEASYIHIFVYAFVVWFKKKLSIPLGEASSSWILSALVVAIEKQSNRVSAIKACLAYVIDLNLNIS